MNMFYTGLGIARSLGARGIPVIGLSARRAVYGNFTRYAKVRRCPDSREAPQELLQFLLGMAKEFPQGGILFPTRDDDVLFLDSFRAKLASHYTLLLPETHPLETCLNKWKTHQAALFAGIASPATWKIRSEDELRAILPEIAFPCVLKPVFAQHWRRPGNWQLVGCRKAVGVASTQELLDEYRRIARAESQVLVQELIPGRDDRLWIAACYMNRLGKFAGGFTAQKLVQVPEAFGTGCVVQTVDRPDLLELAVGLLTKIEYTGIAEVEFKQDADGGFKLIEINPRPWDQHRLGYACGTDLMYQAYRDLARLKDPPARQSGSGHKWIAEDVYWLLLLRSLVKRDGRFCEWRRLANGNRTYAISSIKDPLPTLCFIFMQIFPQLVSTAFTLVRSRFVRFLKLENRGFRYEDSLHKKDCKS
jgi:predicted ATP-grasp superfamily ATP-dependent carboligase